MEYLGTDPEVREAYEEATRRGDDIGVIFRDGIHTPEWWLMTREEYTLCTVTPPSIFNAGGYPYDVAVDDHLAYVFEARGEEQDIPQCVLDSVGKELEEEWLSV